ncbi:MAG: circadian clock KaiB family protein [Gemmatimonadaceae bacterium]
MVPPVAVPSGSFSPRSALMLRLYIAGDAPNSVLAEQNLRLILDAQPKDTYQLEVVDCLKEPLRALEQGVLVTPTLVKHAPPPAQTVVGALSDLPRVRSALGLSAGRHA